MLERINKYWATKSIWSKLSDFIFIGLVIVLLFPQGRMAVGGFVNNIKAQVINPSKLSEEIVVSAENFNWSLKDSKGNIVNLQNYKGKVLFINLWATWCPPCVGEMPEIQELYDTFKSNEDIAFLMISNEKVPKINHFVESKDYSFPVFSSQIEAPTVFGTNSIPTTFVVSKSGKMVIKEIGAANWGGEKMQKLVRDLLEE